MIPHRIPSNEELELPINMLVRDAMYLASRVRQMKLSAENRGGLHDALVTLRDILEGDEE